MSHVVIKEVGAKKVIDMGNGRVRVVTMNDEQSRTQQQFKAQTDVNNIMKKYRSYHHVPFVGVGEFKDVSELPDYMTALNQVRKAEESFMQLSSDVRKKFDNDVHKLIAYLQDEKNTEEAIKLGLVKKPEAPKVDPILETMKEVAKNTAPKKAKASED